MLWLDCDGSGVLQGVDLQPKFRYDRPATNTQPGTRIKTCQLMPEIYVLAFSGENIFNKKMGILFRHVNEKGSKRKFII